MHEAAKIFLVKRREHFSWLLRLEAFHALTYKNTIPLKYIQWKYFVRWRCGKAFQYADRVGMISRVSRSHKHSTKIIGNSFKGQRCLIWELTKTILSGSMIVIETICQHTRFAQNKHISQSKSFRFPPFHMVNGINYELITCTYSIVATKGS